MPSFLEVEVVADFLIVWLFLHLAFFLVPLVVRAFSPLVFSHPAYSHSVVRFLYLVDTLQTAAVAVVDALDIDYDNGHDMKEAVVVVDMLDRGTFAVQAMALGMDRVRPSLVELLLLVHYRVESGEHLLVQDQVAVALRMTMMHEACYFGVA